MPMNIMSPRHLKIANWAILTLLVLAGSLWRGWEFGLGVLVGGLVAVVNFHLLHRALKGLLEPVSLDPEGARGQAKAWFAARQMLRFSALLAVIFLLVSYGWVNIFGLAASIPLSLMLLPALLALSLSLVSTAVTW